MITSEWASDPGHTAHFIARQARFLRAAGVDVDVFAFRGGRRPLRYLTAWARLRRRLAGNGHGYDLVHAQFGQSGLLALPKRLPLVVPFRGSDVLGIVRDRDGRYTTTGKVLQRASRFVARHADAIILVSRHLGDHVQSHAPMHVIPSGIDFSLFRPMPKNAARSKLGLDLREK